MAAPRVDFLTFFVLWAKVQGWTVPLLHVRICLWLEHCTEPQRVLMVFRGAAKSTIYAVYKAWRLYKNRHHRSLVWSADGPTAGMLTADVINVLKNHPLCVGMLPQRPGAKRFWVNGARDARNASMRAVGVTSNATGARADDVDFDDIEVPGNIETPEARLKLRQRIGESTHIAVPGGQKTWIGTPHTHDSIYPECIAGGAAVLKISLFEHTRRFEDTRARRRYEVPFTAGPDGWYVMAGIHKFARMMAEGVDFRVERTATGAVIVIDKPPGAVVDVCARCQWPERFDRKEIERRRKETRTLNAWDSQYMLEAKPLGEVRLDPDRLAVYEVEPVIRTANRETVMMLGLVRIVSAAVRWDPAGGKLNSDVSAVAVCLQDDGGRRYLHRVAALTGDVAEFSDNGREIIGGQVWQLCDIIERFELPRVTVETNGIGKFAPATLKAALKQRGLAVGVKEINEGANKNKRILESWEPLLKATDMLWVHQSVMDGPLTEQMRGWNPTVPNQPDDYLDAGAGAISETPERIGKAIRRAEISAAIGKQDWRPSAGVHEVILTD